EQQRETCGKRHGHAAVGIQAHVYPADPAEEQPEPEQESGPGSRARRRGALPEQEQPRQRGERNGIQVKRREAEDGCGAEPERQRDRGCPGESCPPQAEVSVRNFSTSTACRRRLSARSTLKLRSPTRN